MPFKVTRKTLYMANSVEIMQAVFRGMDTSSGDVTLFKLFCISSEKRAHFKRKEFAPTWSKFFPFEVDPFFNRKIMRRIANRKSKEVCH